MRPWIVAILLTAAIQAQAKPEWLSLDAGARLGLGPETFAGDAHPQPKDPNNLFSNLGPITVERQAALGSGFGIYAAAGWRQKIELQLELFWGIDGSSSVEDIGYGIKREILYERQSIEAPILLKLGWPFSLDQRTILRPYALGGAWGNRVLAAHQRIGLQGSEGQVFDWDGTPNEDWGWCAGAGLEFTRGAAISLEARYREGMKDLDPKGNFEQKARGLQVLLKIGI